MKQEKDIIENAAKSEFVDEKAELVSPERREYEELLQRFDAQTQKKLLRKIDFRLMPVLAVLYLISFMDRSNIGNAR